jgi:hypothetical protein
MQIEIQGERLLLCAEHAVFWPARQTLLIADAHFGKAASFRRLGVPVPRGTTEANLARLDELISGLPDQREIVFLGDFLHAASGRAPATLRALQAWRDRHAGLGLSLVRGNHDSHAGDPPAALGIEVVAELFAEHRQHRCAIGGLQPLGVEVDRAGAACVGALATAHRRCLQELHRRQGARLTRGQAGRELLQRQRGLR